MSRSIKLSPKHGVNPSIPVCFWCGEEKNEIVLMGRIGGKEDIEAPRKVCLDYEPCDKCREIMEKGVFLFEATNHPNGSIPMSHDTDGNELYPTGKWAVMKSEAASEVFNMNLKDGAKLALEPGILDNFIQS